MRKKICIALLALCVAVGAGACSSDESNAAKEENTKTEAADKTEDEADTDKENEDETQDSSEEEKQEEESSAYRMVSVDDVTKYVSVGEYKGLSLEKGVASVTDEMIDSQIQSELESHLETDKDEDAEVQSGDIANINYVGTKDGEAFEGGTAEGFDLTIGSGRFIDGFEDGIIGMKKGETKDLNLTFPEEYPSEDLAGQEVVFQVTLNAIKHVPELSDEWVEENTDYKTVEEYREGVTDELMANEEAARDNTLLNTAFSTVLDGSEVMEYPEEDINLVMNEFKAQIELMAEQAGTDLEGFLEGQSMSEEEFEEQCRQYAEYRVKQALVIQAIMDAEGMTFEDKAAEAAKLQMAQELGATNFDQLVSVYGEYAVYSSLGARVVSQFVIDNAQIQDEGAIEEPEDVGEELTDTAEEAKSADQDETGSEDEAADQDETENEEDTADQDKAESEEDTADQDKAGNEDGTAD
ncbi:MAG: trigger factor [Eubacteriales bacterium]|nr:trigger factor [Eubacteriales bacterium]